MNLMPNPRVVKINPYAFIIICLLVALIVGVIIYSILRTPQIGKNDTHVSVAFTSPRNEKLWYEDVHEYSPRVVQRTEPVINSQPLSNNETSSSAILKSAMSSAIKAPMNDLSNLNNNVQSGSASEPHLINGTEKENFLRGLKEKDDDTLHQVLRKPLSPFILQAGTFIPATLSGGINSELPGQITALVNQNIYDSIRGKYLIIPQGSKLLLTYDANVTLGQQRLLVGVKRIIFPNGNSMNLEGMPGVDASGYAGFHDEVDNHYSRIFGSAAMMGLITGSFQLSQPQQNNNSNNSSISQVMGGALGQQMGQVTMGMMNKNLDIAPTLIIQPGYLFNVEVTKDLVFPGPY